MQWIEKFRSSTNSLDSVKLVGIKPKRSDSSTSEQKMDTEELLEQSTKAVIVRTSSNKNQALDIAMTQLDKPNDIDHHNHRNSVRVSLFK